MTLKSAPSPPPPQLYIPLPCATARRCMIERQLGGDSGVSSSLSESDMTKIVSRTDGYSGSDMKNLIQVRRRTKGTVYCSGVDRFSTYRIYLLLLLSY